MKKTLLCTALLMAFSAAAQEYEWQWAKRGGGKKNAQGESSFYNHNSEQIMDIAVDDDNNYYYLAFMTQLDTEYDGTPVTVYNPEMQSSGMVDIVLISTDCEGTLRWTQTIGGGASDYAYNIELDNNGGLYIGANIRNISSSLDEYLPPHFSPDDVMDVLGDNMGEPNENYKTTALLKYNTSDGSLAWRVMPQGDVTLTFRYAQINQIQVESNGTIHTLIGFAGGTHLNGEVTVSETFTTTFKYYIAKFNSDGELLNVLPLSLEGFLYNQYTDFRYDPVLQRYYLSGMRNQGGTTEFVGLSFNNIPFTQQSFILAFSNTGEEVWRKEMSSVEYSDKRIYALEVDTESNIYILGKYHVVANSTGVSLGTYELPITLGGSTMFAMKLTAGGEVLWTKTPSGYTVDGSWTGIHYSYDLVITDDEVAIATQVSNEIWDDVSIDRPTNHLTDPGLLRLNKETGEAIALHDIMTIAGTRDGMTAVAVDNDGNYITGGYFYKDLFTLEDDNVPTVTKVGNYQSYTDFFVAKLAASECGSGTSGIEEHGYNDIKIYPNPSNGVINIQSDQELKSYGVMNVLGQVLFKGDFTSGQNSISIESLSAGTYILNLTTTDGRRMSNKIVKE